MEDVQNPKKYYFEPVYWAYYFDVTTGATPTTFVPGNDCTREQIVTFIWRALGEPEPEETAFDAYFTDTKSGKFYNKAVNWAYENGITTGLNDGTGRFGVGMACTRAMCVTFLYRAAGSPATSYKIAFTDVKPKNYFYNAVRWAAEKGITTGISPTAFGSNDNVTRGHTVTFLSRYINGQ